MTRALAARVLLVLTLLLSTALGIAAAQDQTPSTQPAAAAAADSSAPLLQYSLPPDKLAKAYALYLVNGVLYFVAGLWSIVVLWLMLRSRFGVRLRSLAERVSRRRFLQAVVVMSVFAIVMELVQLPFDMYSEHISMKYGRSVQTWASWFGDWGKGLLLACIFASILGWILYVALRRSPRRWWFYFWLALIPIIIFVMFIAPVWIEPMFNKYEPLTDHHADLVAQIERVVHRAGMDIPPERMYEMKASEKTTTLNAYVSGFGATKRVVVWDTTMQHMTTPETLFVFGHEMGHYVLGHIPKEIAINLVFLLLLFYVGYRLANWLVAKYGERWGIRSLDDWASLPLAGAASVGTDVCCDARLQRGLASLRASGRPVRSGGDSRSRAGCAAYRRAWPSRSWARSRSTIPTSTSFGNSGRGTTPRFATA